MNAWGLTAGQTSKCLARHINDLTPDFLRGTQLHPQHIIVDRLPHLHIPDGSNTTYDQDMPSTLLTVPGEIRNHIYSYIIAPTGRVCLHRHDSTHLFFAPYPTTSFLQHPTLDLRLLQTCQQVYKECRALFWIENALHFSMNGPYDELLHRQNLMERIHRIELKFLLVPADTSAYILYFKQLGRWAEQGNLHELVLAVNGMGTMSQFGQILRARKAQPVQRRDTLIIFDMLRQGREKTEGVLLVPRRKLDLRFGLQHTSAKVRHLWFKEHPAKDCEDALRDLHEHLGGELYVDGELCYKDNKRMRETFKVWEVETALEALRQ
jgi:hypothetical protein